LKKKYNTDRGTHRINIKRVSDNMKRMAMKIMARKLLRKFHKEEVLVMVVTAATQFVEGTTISWDPYFLNMFLDDWKDAHDMGIEFHYSWLIMLIAIMGWKELKCVFFSTRPKPNHGAIYLLLGTTLDARNKKMNTNIFKGYLCDIEDTIANI
jgi:hypothetical protein